MSLPFIDLKRQPYTKLSNTALCQNNSASSVRTTADIQYSSYLKEICSTLSSIQNKDSMTIIIFTCYYSFYRIFSKIWPGR